jgi:glycosyltransferase involved in cell wall biosynthesis
MTRLLLYAQVPPPVHGQSVMVGHLIEGLRASDAAVELPGPVTAATTVAYRHINPQISEDFGDIGRWRLRKILLVFKFIAQAIAARFRHGLDTLYFVPAPPKREGMYRDWCVLFLLRPFYPRLVLHWHCIGQPAFIEGKLNALERAIARLAYGKAALSIALSNYSHTESAWFSPVHNVTVANGIPDPCPDFDAAVWPQRQQRAAALAATESMIYEVLFVAGRMTPKGLFDAMAAILHANQSLAQQGSARRLRLTVAGSFEGDERARFDVAVREINATQRPGQTEPLVVDAGWADEAKKRELYRRADCFIFPTTYSAESFGLVITEAMAHGCAVITTRWQAVPEVLPSGYEHIVEPHDIPAMADSLLLCLAAPADRTLRDYFLARFTSERFAAEMIRVLGEV